MNESALLKSARNLDQKALVTIFDIYAPAVYRYCFRLCQDSVASDNLVGDVFSRLLENMASGRGPLIHLKLYIFQMTYQAILARVDKDRMPATHIMREVVEIKRPLVKTWSSQEQELLRLTLIALNTDLTSIQRHVLFLRYFEDFSLQETALIVGKNVNNIKVIQNRALAKLSQVLETHNETDLPGFVSGIDS
jgi:RNA polymerase sigma-70 factor (ECF subfamily)